MARPRPRPRPRRQQRFPFSPRSAKKHHPLYLFPAWRRFFFSPRRSARSAKKHHSVYFFPEQIWIEILSHLPIKSLLRFRSVSTTWKSIIQDFNFARLHLKRCPNNILRSDLSLWEGFPHEKWSIRNCETLEETSGIELPVKRTKRRWNLCGTVNGIFLLYRCKFYSYREKDVLLWNPSIRRHLHIPLPLTLIALPRTSLYFFELYLGLDSSDGDHKVIIIIHIVQPPAVEVFSVKTRSWRKLEPETTRIRNVCMVTHTCNQVTFGGSVHWVGSGYSRTNLELVSFNVASELFSYTSLPYFRNADHQKIKAIVVGENMGKIVPRGSSYFDRSSIWSLTSSGSWTKLHKFSLDYDLILYYRMHIDHTYFCHRQLFCLESTTETPNSVVRMRQHDPATWRSKVVSLNIRTSLPLYVETYIESLVLL